MEVMARRSFIRGATIGALAFTIGGAEVLLTPAQARAQGVAFKVLTPAEVRTLEMIGDVLAIGARQAGIAHFVDQQLGVPPGYALFSVRVADIRPPYVEFYRNALATIDAAAQAPGGFAALSEADQFAFVGRLSRGEVAGWNGRVSQAAVYAALRNDAVDVVYGTVDGFARIGVPYLPHILPERNW